MTLTPAHTIWTPTVGDLVIATYRLPTPHQHWLHHVRVGRVVEPGTDPAAWNGHNSEADYCRDCGYTALEYAWEQGLTRMHDATGSLFPVPPGVTGEWMVEDEAEAWNLVHRGMAYAGRHHNDRCKAVELAFAWHGGGGNPLYQFASTRQVHDDKHRERLLAEIEGCLAHAGEGDTAALRDLRGIARHVRAGIELMADDELFVS